MFAPQLERALGRKPHHFNATLDSLRTERILVTGAKGSLGAAAAQVLERNNIAVVGTDLLGPMSLDVTDAQLVNEFVATFDPTLILNLAGAKHAPEGEVDPLEVTRVNTLGTANLLATGRRVVLASTCKACNPQTAYGASKLIAERMTLNAGGSVARFFNVIETSGNVFHIWGQIKGDIPVADCWRYFITLDEAVALLLHAATHPGRWIVDPGELRFMPDVAKDLHPDRKRYVIPARRGDRIAEPLHADHELILDTSGPFRKVVSPHD